MLRTLIFGLLLVYSQLVYSQYNQSSTWTDEQRVLAGILAVEIVQDWHGTRDLARHNWCYDPRLVNDHGCVELNPILGRYPSTSRIDTHFIVSGLALYLLLEFVPEYRTDILRISVITEGLIVGNNVIRFGWRW